VIIGRACSLQLVNGFSRLLIDRPESSLWNTTLLHGGLAVRLRSPTLAFSPLKRPEIMGKLTARVAAEP
jgi:hypothetical protein